MSKRKDPFKKMLTVTAADRAQIDRAESVTLATDFMLAIVEGAVGNCKAIGVPEATAIQCLMHMMAHHAVKVIGLDGVEKVCNQVLLTVKDVKS